MPSPSLKIAENLHSVSNPLNTIYQTINTVEQTVANTDKNGELEHKNEYMRNNADNLSKAQFYIYA